MDSDEDDSMSLVQNLLCLTQRRQDLAKEQLDVISGANQCQMRQVCSILGLFPV